MIKSTTIWRNRETPPIPTDVARYDPYAMAALLGFDTPATRLPVTERTVVGLPAAWAAVNKISNAVAQMMSAADAYDGAELLDPRPNIVDRPNYAYGRYTFWKEAASTALMRGNFVGLLTDADEGGYPQQVVPIPTEMVYCTVNEHGYVDYEIGDAHYTADQVVHVRTGVTLPGDPWAIGVIEAHRRGLSGQIDQQGMANDIWRNGAVPSGIVQLQTDTPTTAQVTAVKTAWISNNLGQRTVAVTGKNMTYTPITWSAEDAQFIEARQFSAAEVALMFGLRPSDLDAAIGGSSLTYGNRMDDAMQRITDAYMPVLLPIEEAWSDLLPRRLYVKGNVEALLRSTTKERYEVHEIAQRIGLQTTAETREIEGRPTTEEVPDEN